MIRWALAVTAVAVLSHFLDIGWRSFLRVHPAQSIREATGFLAVMVSGGALVATWRRPSPLLMMATMPIALVLLLLARLSPIGAHHSEALTVVGRTHIIFATVGLAAFAVASLLAAVYLLEQRSLKTKRFSALGFRAGGTPLEALDRWSHRLAWLGWPTFTLALILGAVWTAQRGASYARIENALALGAWALFTAVLAGRVAGNWHGRRSAKVMVLGFALGLLAVVWYLAKRVWG